MASLLVRMDGQADRVIELKLGLNRLGRSAGNDFQIEHPTISAQHCEIWLKDGEVRVLDHDSTNGTFVDDQLIREETLRAGQTLRLGEIEMLVECTDVRIAIPRFEIPLPPVPVASANGTVNCRRHPLAPTTHRCTHCGELLCDNCVTRLRRRGGKMLKLCGLCSHKVEPLAGPRKKKRSFFALLQQTVKLPFLRNSARVEEEV